VAPRREQPGGTSRPRPQWHVATWSYAFQMTTSCSISIWRCGKHAVANVRRSDQACPSRWLSGIDEKVGVAVADARVAAAQAFQASSSIMRPADAPVILKMQRRFFAQSGWLERRFSLQIRILEEFLCTFGGKSSFTASIISSAQTKCDGIRGNCSPEDSIRRAARGRA